MNTSRSSELFAEAQSILVGGVNSPVRAFKAVGGNPFFAASGKGACVTDADGNEYIDYVLSWGPLVLGHAYPDRKSVVQGTSVDLGGRRTRKKRK